MKKMDANDPFAAARQYADAGICAFAVPANSKKMASEWTHWQTHIPTSEEHKKMFAKRANVGIMMGEVSGGLACRDFDKRDAYRAFRVNFPKLAYSIPTVETASGKCHIYFRLASTAREHFAEKCYIKIGDAEGELRIRNCYCVAPPSRIGERDYRWVIDGPFPEIDPRDYFLDLPLADLPFAKVRAGVGGYLEKLNEAKRHKGLPPIGDGGRHVDDWEFLWRLASLESNGTIASSVVEESFYALKSEKPDNRVAYLRTALKIRCDALGVDFHQLLGQVRLPSELPPSPPSQKIPDRTEPDRIGVMQHKRAQEDTRDSGGAGISGDSGDSSHEGGGGKTSTQQSKSAPTKQKPYSGPVLKIGELGAELEKEIETAIAATLPKGKGRREALLLELARRFKAIPRCASLEIWAFMELIREWHRRAFEKIGTKPFTDTWKDFVRAWKRVRIPYGEALKRLFTESKKLPIPACVAHHDLSAIGEVARLCKVLQSKMGGEPFWLSCRALAELLGVHETTAWRWLCMACDEGWLLVVTKGSHVSKRATEYFYCGD